jgi:hypothetical protein
LLAQGHTIRTVCEAVGIAERNYFDWREKHLHFSQATTCAIGKSKIVLVNKLRRSDDWRASAFLLERRFPVEYGRVAEREIPLPKGAKRIGVTFILTTPDGSQRQTSFEEAQKMFAMFPIADTCEPPAEEGKSLPGPDADSDVNLDGDDSP